MRRMLIPSMFFSALLALTVGAAQAATVLYAVSGEHSSEPNPESLYTLSMSDGSATFLQAFGAGSGGETIGFHDGNGLLYHASGGGAANDPVNGEILETFDPATLAVTNVPLSGVEYNEALALTYDSANTQLLLADLNDDLHGVTGGGVVSSIGTLDHDAKGLAFVGSTLYSVDRDTNTLRSVNATTAATLTSIAITISGGTVTGATGLATNPDTGVLWALLKISGESSNRRLATIDPVTGVATSIGGTGGRFAGIAFGPEPIPEPSTGLLLGLGLLGLARNRRTRA